ncbi:MAG TPA: phage virion morphogenesis protein [Polyangia bacterium]|nr:phage virion morphogenesis protein [Polyangia bacterium]
MLALTAPGFRDGLVRRLGADALKLVADGFRRSSDPYGDKWKSLGYRRGKPLLDTGRLRASFAVEPTGAGFRIGSVVTYAGYHQYGTRPHSRAARVAMQNARGRFMSMQARKVKRKAFEGTERRGGFLVRIREHRSNGIPARPMLPTDSRGLPPKWESVFQRSLETQVRGYLRAP